MHLVQGLVFAILTEKNCWFLFRTETDKEIKMQNHSLAATSFPLPRGHHKIKDNDIAERQTMWEKADTACRVNTGYFPLFLGGQTPPLR